jgi:hypothetical protein
MEAASATGVRADYSGLALRTRARSSESAACHTPGCRNRAPDGRMFCAGCQATLDRVREELRAAGPGGRKPRVRRAA